MDLKKNGTNEQNRNRSIEKKKLKIELPYDPAILLPGIYPDKVII